MNSQRKGILILISFLGFFTIVSVLEIVYSHTYRMLTMFGIFAGMFLLAYPLGKWARDFKRIIEGLPADHKVITQSIAAVDIGDIRFIYRVYEKGRGINPASKSYISMEVAIPFPEEEAGNGENPSIRESIKCDLKLLIDTLNESGILTGYNAIVQESEWNGQPFLLEFLQKSVMPPKMASIQDKVIDIVNKYQLQQVSWCTIDGGESGTVYRYHKGNLLQSSVLVKEAYDRRYSDYKEMAPLQAVEFDNRFSVEGYRELYEMASKDLGSEAFHFNEVKKMIKRFFLTNKKNWMVRITGDQDQISVNITIPSQKAGSTYHLIRTNERWWILAEGRLNKIDPTSIDDESAACDLFLRILFRLVERY